MNEKDRNGVCPKCGEPMSQKYKYCYQCYLDSKVNKPFLEKLDEKNVYSNRGRRFKADGWSVLAENITVLSIPVFVVILIISKLIKFDEFTYVTIIAVLVFLPVVIYIIGLLRNIYIFLKKLNK